ncbi:MAG: N-acetylmuramic acid 6-phosphate etherase [Candidatus Eremiobacteraeota bacterium]|nr:N-acetylmuramic acid 6-phosphate etherase [Candidatus Eremiobacteraeota bacterium]
MSGTLPQTESVNPRTRGLDAFSSSDLVNVLIEEHHVAVDAVYAVREAIAAAVDIIAPRLRSGGRLHYIGAGTSGRLGYLDASEAPPTFGTSPDLVCAHIAGGPAALTRAIEGAEDNGDLAADEMRDHVAANDVVIGLSASGNAAYVVAGLLTARASGAWTLSVTNSSGSKLEKVADRSIVLNSGPEPLTGSTRLKAGTAQKVFLNTLSTAVMVRLGKVHDNLMVDVVATNEKLRERAIRLVATLAEVDAARAAELLAAAQGRVKVAVVMSTRGVEADAARACLESNGGSLRACL